VALAHGAALARRELRAAQRLLCEWAATCPARPGMDAHASLAVRIADAQTRLACGDTAGAADLAAAVEADAGAAGTPHAAVRALLLRSAAFAAAGAQIQALPFAQQALEGARAHGMDGLRWEALVALCELWTELWGGAAASEEDEPQREAAKAAASLRMAMPQLCAEASLDCRARAHFALARAALFRRWPCGIDCPAVAADADGEPAALLRAAAEAWGAAHCASRAAVAWHALAVLAQAEGRSGERDEAAERALLCAQGPPAVTGGLEAVFGLVGG
jgi:hypothetical protein